MTKFRLHLFGTCHLRGPSGFVSGRASQPRQLAFLAVIAASPGGATRDRIADLLWPEGSQFDARHLVADTLHVLRRTLGEGSAVTAGESVYLDPARVWCDQAEFLAARSAADPERMLELYQGPFLDGFHGAGGPGFVEWVEGERLRCGEVALEAAKSLVGSCVARGDISQAIAWLRPGRAIDPFDEALAGDLMRLLSVVGNRAEAVRVYRLLHERLSRELDLAPSAQTRALYEQVVEGSVPDVVELAAGSGQVALAASGRGH